MHNGDTFALDVDRDCDVDIASAAKTSTRQLFGGGHRRSHSDWEGGGGNRDNFKRASIEALYGTGHGISKVLIDFLTTSLTASTYADYEGIKIRLLAEFCIDKEGTSPPDCAPRRRASATSPDSRSAGPSAPAP
eukprot:jgi/Tetstr1/439869/TSEL_028278.t1